MLAPQKSLFSDVLAVSGFCHGGAPVFLLVLALCCRSTCQFRRNSEKSNHMLSATSHIELEFLTNFLNMSKLQNRLILLYQSLPLHHSSSSSLQNRNIRIAIFVMSRGNTRTLCFVCPPSRLLLFLMSLVVVENGSLLIIPFNTNGGAAASSK